MPSDIIAFNSLPEIPAATQRFLNVFGACLPHRGLGLSGFTRPVSITNIGTQEGIAFINTIPVTRNQLQVMYGGARGGGKQIDHDGWARMRELMDLRPSPLSLGNWNEVIAEATTATENPSPPMDMDALRYAAETVERITQEMDRGAWAVLCRHNIRRAVGNSKRARRSSRWPDFGAIQQDIRHTAAAREYVAMRQAVTA